MEGFFLWAKKNRRWGAFLACRHFRSKKVDTEEYVHQNVLRLYQVGNTSPCKNTEFKQLWPWLALGSVTRQRLDVDAVATNTVKSQNTSGAQKKKVFTRLIDYREV